MSTPKLLKTLHNHLRWALTHYSEHADFTPVDGLQKWMVRIRGLDGTDQDDKCLVGAEILITFDTTHEFGGSGSQRNPYPYSPPRFKVHTPNGLYGVDGIVCVKIGEYHPEDYMPELGIGGFTMYLISGLTDTDKKGETKLDGIRLDRAESSTMAELSAKSKEHNMAHYAAVLRRLHTQYLALVGSGLWRPSDENADRLVKAHNGETHKDKYTDLSNKIIGWASMSDGSGGFLENVRTVLGGEPAPAEGVDFAGLVAAADQRWGGGVRRTSCASPPLTPPGGFVG